MSELAYGKSTGKELFAREKDIDVLQYLRILLIYRWRILLFSFGVAIAAVAVLFNVQSMYQSSARLMIESEQAQAVSIEAVYGLDASRQEYLFTQFEIIKSRELAQRVIDRLRLQHHPEFIAEQGSVISNALEPWLSEVPHWLAWLPQWLKGEAPEPSKQSMIDRMLLLEEFSKRLVVTPIPQTQLVDIGFYAYDPALAATVANTMGQIYIENHLEAKLDMTRSASQWLSERLDELLVGLRHSEEKLQAFREKEGLLEFDGVVGTASQEINDLSQQLALTRQRREEAKSLYELVQRKGVNNIDSLEGLTEISIHPLVEQVKQAEVQASANVAELSRRYGPKHNKMIAAEAQLAQVRRNMKAQIGKLVRGIEQEYHTLNASVKGLEQQLGAIKSDYQEQGRVEVEYRELQREVESNRRIYETFLNRMKETGAVADFDAAHARFTDWAEPALQPAKPKKKLIVIAVTLLSLLMACVMALIHNNVTDTIRTAEQVENKLATKLLSAIPQHVIPAQLGTDLSTMKDGYSFAEAWRTVRTNYLLSHLEDEAKTLCVTSTVPSEGKTTSAYHLCLAFAQLEKVLLIEADLRKPVLAHLLQLPSYQPGLANILCGTHQLEDCTFSVPEQQLDVLVAGTRTVNPLELIADPSFSQLLEKLKTQYDRIVIDTAPVDVVSDALVVAQQVDSVIYVVRSGKVHSDLIQRSLQRLFASHGRIDGIVLNAVPKDLTSYRQYQSYYGATSRQG